MIIRSNFVDYYDLNFVNADGKVFNRSTVSKKFTVQPKTPDLVSVESSDGYLKDFIVLFAGKAYYGIVFQVSFTDTPCYCYSAAQLAKDLVKSGAEHFLNSSRTGLPAKDRIARIKHLFNASGADQPSVKDFMIEHKISIATDLWHDSNSTLQINPKLSDIGFQRKFDPLTAYQELSMWIDGVLTEPDPPTSMTNEQKILSHGFDLKYSFRKTKQ